MKNYAPYMDPQTYLQFMNPAAYDISAITGGAGGTGEALGSMNPIELFSEMFKMSENSAQ